jgi:uncharacterized protein (TIGR03118 family)
MMLKHAIAVTALLAAAPAWAGSFTQTNLVSDGAVTAAVTDPNLKNPWGISVSPTGPFWVSDNATGLTTVYQGSGAIEPLVVTIPAAAGSTGPGSPTGQVFHSGSGFVVSEGDNALPALFLFATEDGTISGYAPNVDSVKAVVAVDRSAVGAGAVYKGLALYTTAAGASYLLATDFRNNEVDVFDSAFHLVRSFRDAALPADYAPYNVANLDGKLYVTYAKQDAAKHDSVSGPGLGAVERVSLGGKVLARAVGGELNAPWGLALAPTGFGPFANHLLVGNFGNGHIGGFTRKLTPSGQLRGAHGKALAIPGLWGLIVGNGGLGGSASDVYFAAGTNHEADGLFGSLSYAP